MRTYNVIWSNALLTPSYMIGQIRTIKHAVREVIVGLHTEKVKGREDISITSMGEN